ncbi:MAG: hypothetical protein ACPMAG_04465 [Limisphaerales bacterium]|jgi:O-antigen/teichoic acid export membrane protein
MNSSDSQKARFFRQSGWMVISTFLGGACMFAVHFFAPFLGDTEYGLLGTLLAMMNVMMIPSLGLQTTLAQEGAAALTPEDRARFSGTVRGVLFWTFVLWLVMAVFIGIFKNHFLSTLTISNPVALWLVVIIGLGLLWQPIIQGVLQGKQNFLWLGWVLITNGAGRLIAVAIIVVLLGGKATGAIAGALIGIASAISLGLYQIRDVLLAKERHPFDWRKWLGRVIPLTIGLGTSQFIFSVDMIIVRAIFGEHQTGYYSFSGMIGRGLVMFTAPLAAVMFPKIVQSTVQKKKSNFLFLTFLSTAILGIIAATLCTVVCKIASYSINNPELVKTYIPGKILNFLIQHQEAVLPVAKMIPWFVWCMLPLSLANVLLNNLLAKQEYRAVPWLLVVVCAYATAQIVFGTSFIRVIQILGIFNLIYLIILAIFTKFSESNFSQEIKPLASIG